LAHSVSIGISTVVVDSIDTMIANANAQLYRAKLQKRNQV
jgi:PleD family two-component response regulator